MDRRIETTKDVCTGDRSSPSEHRTLLLATILASYSMIVIDNSVVITGLPSIRASLGFSPAGLSWVQNAYALTFGGLLLLGARAGDLLGRRRMFIIGLAIFSAASMAIGLAASSVWLVWSRAVQGIGAAILAPSTLALLSATFAEGPQRSRALGWYGAVGGITASVGLVIGGIVADLVSWRAGFFINVPIGALLIWSAFRHIDETPRERGSFDLPGALLSTLGMVCLVYGLVHAADQGWAQWATLTPLVIAVVVLALFLLTETRAAQPILPLQLFHSPTRSGAYAARVLFTGAAMGFFFYATQFLQNVLGLRALWAGVAFLPSMLLNFIGALASSRLVPRYGNRRVLVAALVISLAGMAGLGRVDSHSSFVFGVMLPMLLIGAGMGASLSSLTIAGVAGVPREQMGSASGAVNVAHQLGGSLGLALLVVVSAMASPSSNADARVELAHRVAAALSAAAAMLAIALLIVLLCLANKRTIADAAKREVKNPN